MTWRKWIIILVAGPKTFTAMNWAVEGGRIIILEDDCVPSQPSFLTATICWKNIMMIKGFDLISGNNYCQNTSLTHYFYISPIVKAGQLGVAALKTLILQCRIGLEINVCCCLDYPLMNPGSSANVRFSLSGQIRLAHGMSGRFLLLPTEGWVSCQEPIL